MSIDPLRAASTLCREASAWFRRLPAPLFALGIITVAVIRWGATIGPVFTELFRNAARVFPEPYGWMDSSLGVIIVMKLLHYPSERVWNWVGYLGFAAMAGTAILLTRRAGLWWREALVLITLSPAFGVLTNVMGHYDYFTLIGSAPALVKGGGMSEATTKPVLGVIIASTRPGRIGKPIGDWFIEQATADGSFEVRTLDLAEINLPFMDEPNHPRLRKYTKQHTLDWSAQVEACDAFVLVTCEYNYGPPAALKNAFDFLSQEWADKPVGLLSYGGVSGGLRCASHLKETFQALGLLCVREAITVPMAGPKVVDGVFQAPAECQESVAPMLASILKRHEVLAPLRG